MFQRTRNNIISAVFAVALVILIISVSIGLPIYTRSFYYAHVDILNMPENTGYTRDEIIDAYDEMMDYLTIDGNEFGTGILEYSEEGKAHFEDCKFLFDLNRNALLLSLVTVVLLIVLDKKGVITLARPCGLRMSFWSGICTLVGFLGLGIVCAANFDTAFTTFHKIFFPGKDNWMFNSRLDQIILAMPSTFFMRCAILIASSIILISLLFVLLGVAYKGKKKKL